MQSFFASVTAAACVACVNSTGDQVADDLVNAFPPARARVKLLPDVFRLPRQRDVMPRVVGDRVHVSGLSSFHDGLSGDKRLRTAHVATLPSISRCASIGNSAHVLASFSPPAE